MDDEAPADGEVPVDADTDGIQWAHPDENATTDEPPIPSWLETRDDDLGLGAAIVVPEPGAWVPAPAVNAQASDVDEDEVDLGDDPFGAPTEDSSGDERDGSVTDPSPVEDHTDAKVDDEADDHAAIDAEDDVDAADDAGIDDDDSDAAASDDDDWDDDEDWATDEPTFASTVFASRPARITIVVAVVTVVVLLMSTVLLWQRVEDVKADVTTIPTQPVDDSQLAELRRRLARLETQVASTLDDTGNVVEPTEALRAELAALRQCVAAFQQQIAQGQRVATVIC